MKKMKKLTAGLVAATMMVSLAACGQNSGTEGSSAAETVSSAPSAESSATAESQTAASEPVTITFWDENAGDQRTEYYMKLISDFESKNPNIHIEYLGLSFSDSLSKYQTAIIAGETPDVGGINNAWASTVIGMNHCVDISDYLASWDEGKNMDEGALEIAKTYNKDGNLYMLPTTTNFMCMWVNETMLANAGVETPVTWDDFFSAVETITNKDESIYGYTIRGGAGSPSVLFDLIYSYMGTNVVFDENGKCTINSDEAIEFTERYLDLYGKFTPESDITAAYKEISANFDSGVSAMLMHNLGSYSAHAKAFPEGGFVAAPYPTAANGNYVNFGGSIGGVAMFDTCEHPEEAWKWISFLASHEANSYWNQSIGQLPTNTLCYEDSWMKEMQHIQCATTQLSADNTLTYTSPTFLPEWGSINSTYIEPAIQSVMSKEMTAKELLDLWADYLNEAYADYIS